MKSVLTNIVLADISEGFHFFLYTVDCHDAFGKQIESIHRRRFLFDEGIWNGVLKDMPKKEQDDLRRSIFFSGSYLFSARKIPGIDPASLPMQLPVGDLGEGDCIRLVKFEHYTAPLELKKAAQTISNAGEVKFDNRCANCTKAFPDMAGLLQHCRVSGHAPVFVSEGSDGESKPAQVGVFISYVNQALKRALGEKLASWGAEFIDPTDVKEPCDRSGRSLGVRVFRAYSCSFGLLRNPRGIGTLSMTVDLRAKVLRTVSVLDQLCGNLNPSNYRPNAHEQERLKRNWIGEVVITMYDKKCYSVTDLIFDQSPASMPVQGLGMSHAEYFSKRKGMTLKFPNAKPMIAVMAKSKVVYLPAELVAGNELEKNVKEQLPLICSFKPEDRNQAIEKIRGFLVPKSRGSGNLLPALGIQLKNDRLSVQARVLPVPRMIAAGVDIPSKLGQNWAPQISKADFRVDPRQANTLNVVLVHNNKIDNPLSAYNKLCRFVNNINSTFRLSSKPAYIISAGDNERHWGPIERHLGGKQSHENVFVLDFNKPAQGNTDVAYSVIKQMLTSNGYVSQFVNYRTHDHSRGDEKRSMIILQGVARQIVQKMGIRLWWVNVPRSLPTPCVFVGVDVFHAPRVYDPKQKKKVAPGSCAAIIVQINRGEPDRSGQVELFTKTFAREPGNEFSLGNPLKDTVSKALRELNVVPESCVVWRDGIDEAAEKQIEEEIQGVRDGLSGGTPVGMSKGKETPMSFVVCQKRIDTKILSNGVQNESDGKYNAPCGTLVENLQSLRYDTFYINGTAPPFSTSKPVRYIVVNHDKEMEKVPLPELTWELCHDYPNWVSIKGRKVPESTWFANHSFRHCRLVQSRSHPWFRWLTSLPNLAAASLTAAEASMLPSTRTRFTFFRISGPPSSTYHSR